MTSKRPSTSSSRGGEEFDAGGRARGPHPHPIKHLLSSALFSHDTSSSSRLQHCPASPAVRCSEEEEQGRSSSDEEEETMMGKPGADGTTFFALLLLLSLFLSSAPLHCSAAFNRKQQQPPPPSVTKEYWSPPSSPRRPEPPSVDVGGKSSVVFPLYGNVYPDG
ncbi:hypothetical protein Taro_036715 [Colocasia esculenta]|uniref:Uncharacterized protein n=1 Tax=Colocasia esculenta TaxID=4460 RepID=A0A843WIM3_COLES|nr:hypothetical protein [Colocasia esculenta]